MKKFIFIIVITGLISCKKFSHDTEPLVAQSCELCAYADALTGEYEGMIDGILNPFFGSNNGLMHVELEHIFLDQGAYIDSTIMFMKMTSILVPNQDTNVTILTFESPDGRVSNSHIPQFLLNPDSIYIYQTFFSHNTGETVLIDYTGIRQ